MASLTQLVKSKKQFSQLFSTFIGISPAVALSEGRLFTTFLTVASETHWKQNFLFSLNLCFNNTTMIGKPVNNILHFVTGDI